MGLQDDSRLVAGARLHVSSARQLVAGLASDPLNSEAPGIHLSFTAPALMLMGNSNADQSFLTTTTTTNSTVISLGVIGGTHAQVGHTNCVVFDIQAGHTNCILLGLLGLARLSVSGA